MKTWRKVGKEGGKTYLTCKIHSLKKVTYVVSNLANTPSHVEGERTEVEEGVWTEEGT
jgi:hypothetical protein